jgi:DNA-binding SARP family transcriptional activator
MHDREQPDYVPTRDHYRYIHHDVRTRLREELGIDPSAELQDLYRQFAGRPESGFQQARQFEAIVEPQLPSLSG